MAPTFSAVQSEFSSDHALPGGMRKRPSLVTRAARRVTRFLIVLCIGVAATLAWQSYGDVARAMIANASPQLGWLAPEAAPVTQTAPDMTARVASAAPSADVHSSGAAQELRSVSTPCGKGGPARGPGRCRTPADGGRYRQAASGDIAASAAGVRRSDRCSSGRRSGRCCSGAQTCAADAGNAIVADSATAGALTAGRRDHPPATPAVTPCAALLHARTGRRCQPP